ncbi:unnamed protein product [Didymodactylos carnosus]|uniref:Reverse transcriptase domain-containing protein n=1 Tax=Didymodactylos carnosus TaxID=1234261 RepID=A0A8S2DVG4_9BILA|nr:unnamed protein product [Didymodactylos carnosus]CAF3780321.1 unnamed protein product [Didymodactylos carnosus]CAF4522906.1 unnamed protein product [Didymodactylos carnosus]
MQSGFIRDDSSVNQLIDFVHTIYRNGDKGQITRAIFLDFSKAFDRVWLRGLLHKLEMKGIGGSLLSWFQSYVSDSEIITVIIGSLSSLKKVNRGVPQGSVPDPLLFLVFIDDIGESLNSCTRLFADDTVIHHSDSDIHDLTAHLNNDLLKMHQWSAEWQLPVNEKKCESMTFSYNLTPPPLVINNISLNQVKKRKHLGIFLTSKLDWLVHQQHVLNKCKVIKYDKNM